MAGRHADFYVAVAAAIPVLYVVVALQQETWAYMHSMTTGSPTERMIASMFNRLIYGILPLSAVGLAVFALMTESDATWMRIWAFAGVLSILILTLAGVAASGGAIPNELPVSSEPPAGAT